MNPRCYRAFFLGAASSLFLVAGTWLLWVWLGSPALPTLTWTRGGGMALVGGAGSAVDWWWPIRTLRALVKTDLVPLGIAVVGLSLAAAAYLAQRRGRAGVPPGLMLVSVALATAGEMLILAGRTGWGAALYLAGGIVLVVTLAVTRNEPNDALEPLAWHPRHEALAAALIMLLVIASRLYQIGDIPYGWEGDEVNWVAHVVQSYSRPEREREYPLNRMPTSYLMQAPAYKLMGISVNTARRNIALFSILATLLFYLAVREMVNIPVALLATYLMAISIVDLAASRVSHVEAHVKIWSILAALCLVAGYRRGKPWLFLAAGVALALGLMVYDSFVLVPLPFLVYMVYRLARDRANWRSHAASVGLLLLPILIVVPTVWSYLSERRANQLAILVSATGVLPDSLQKLPQLLPQLPAYVVKQAGVLGQRMTFQAVPDVLLGRVGPLESAAFVPFLAVGLILAIRYWRRGQVLFALLWLLIPALPTSLIIGQASPRTFFPYWGAFQIMAAIALWVLYRAWSDLLVGRWRWLPAVSIGLALGVVGISNLYVYFNEVHDPPDRQLRRELGDLARRSIAPGELVLMPYLPLWGDILGVERHVQWIETRDRVPLDHEKDYYRFVPYPELLAQISAVRTQVSGLKLVYDKSIQPPGIRQDILNAFKRCFPGLQQEVGRAFDVYAVNAKALAASGCYSDVAIRPTQPITTTPIAAKATPRFEWQATKGGQTAYQLWLDRQNERVVWLEAESFVTARGWEPAAALAPDYSGAAYLQDAEIADGVSTTQRALVPVSGSYELWVRTYRRRDDHSPAYLSLDGRPMEIARPVAEAFNRWQWERLGPQTLAAGPHDLVLTRHYDKSKDPWFIFVDVVALSADPDFDPNRQTNWDPVLDTGIVETSDRALTLPEPLPPGHYRWRVKITDGDRLVAPDGTIGLASPNSFFSVAP